MTNGAQSGPLVPPRLNVTVAPPFPGFTGPPYDTDPKVDRCAHIDTFYDLTTASLCSVYILFGILYTFAGYRCFKTSMFLTGFIFASSIIYCICLQGELMPPYGNAGVAVLAGVMFGLITMLNQYVGLFMGGLHTGILIGVTSLMTADHIIQTPTKSVWTCLGVLLASALLFAVLNLYFKKGLTIISTCLYGSYIVTLAVDYFVEKLALITWMWERVSLLPVQPPPCWYSWIVLGIWPSFAITGVVIQFALTGRGIHHEDGFGVRKPRPPKTRGQTRAERAEMRQKKYRYLYQVRTAHGDVISQNFVQAMQKKDAEIGQPGECSTLQSDATNLTILPPDAQLSVLTESEDDSQTEIATRR